ncbi:MAG TPA: molybdopterin converting factor subunit 1 [bacterium]
MKIKVKFFAVLREKAGVDSLTIDMDNGTRLTDLKKYLSERFWNKMKIDRGVAVAVNGEVTNKDARLSDGDEIAFLPPVSGGL